MNGVSKPGFRFISALLDKLPELIEVVCEICAMSVIVTFFDVSPALSDTIGEGIV